MTGFPGGSDGEDSACNAGDLGSIPGQEDPLEKGMATRYPCLENPTDRGVWRATVHGVTRVRHDQAQHRSWCLNMQNSNKTENKYKQVEQAVDIYVNYLFILLLYFI